MFFEISKIFWALAQPANLLFILLLLGVAVMWRWPRFGRWGITLLVLVAFILGTVPLGEYLLRKIEAEYPMPTLPARVDGIIVLGGFVWLEGSATHNAIQFDSKAERLTTFIALAHQYPNAKLVFSGGSGNPLFQEKREADFVRQAWTDMGLDPARVLWERDSRNTYENAVASKRLAKPKPGETWILVTSALHMPRAVAIFDQQNWNVIPYPVDFITANTPLWQREWSVTHNLWLLASALREIYGRWAYQATGKAS